jgi:glycosyltransferase involved in cell wall biosynthesis
VHFTGPVSYQRIPEYMRAFDVCIVPHRMTPFTESLNPIKLWEYLAVGKPIVATPVAGFRDYPQFVSLAATADQFLAAMQAALTEDPGSAPARRAEAAKHSWVSRVDQIETVLADSVERRKRAAAQKSHL